MCYFFCSCPKGLCHPEHREPLGRRPKGLKSRIPRRDFARDVCEMFHCVQHDKRPKYTGKQVLKNKA